MLLLLLLFLLGVASQGEVRHNLTSLQSLFHPEKSPGPEDFLALERAALDLGCRECAAFAVSVFSSFNMTAFSVDAMEIVHEDDVHSDDDDEEEEEDTTNSKNLECEECKAEARNSCANLASHYLDHFPSDPEYLVHAKELLLSLSRAGTSARPRAIAARLAQADWGLSGHGRGVDLVGSVGAAFALDRSNTTLLLRLFQALSRAGNVTGAVAEVFSAYKRDRSPYHGANTRGHHDLVSAFKLRFDADRIERQGRLGALAAPLDTMWPRVVANHRAVAEEIVSGVYDPEVLECTRAGDCVDHDRIALPIYALDIETQLKRIEDTYNRCVYLTPESDSDLADPEPFLTETGTMPCAYTASPDHPWLAAITQYLNDSTVFTVIAGAKQLQAPLLDGLAGPQFAQLAERVSRAVARAGYFVIDASASWNGQQGLSFDEALLQEWEQGERPNNKRDQTLVCLSPTSQIKIKIKLAKELPPWKGE
jgi:hypothetical protein